MRVLANPDNVDLLFERTKVPYVLQKDGQDVQIEMPALRCRSCGWSSLAGVKGLPFPHECLPDMSVRADVLGLAKPIEHFGASS